MQTTRSAAPGAVVPSEEEVRAATWRLRMNAPENELPTGLPTVLMLGRTDDLVVAMLGLEAFTTGLSFQISVRMRTSGRGLLRNRLSDLVSGHVLAADDVAATQRLLLGVEFADGRTATNLLGRQAPGPEESEWPAERQRPLLSSYGGSGGGRRHDQRYWLSPLPPAGPLTVVCAWPGVGIAESRFVLDGAAIAAAGQRAQVLWPYVDDQPQDNASPGVPDVPAGSWFAAAQERPPRLA